MERVRSHRRRHQHLRPEARFTSAVCLKHPILPSRVRPTVDLDESRRQARLSGRLHPNRRLESSIAFRKSPKSTCMSFHRAFVSVHQEPRFSLFSRAQGCVGGFSSAVHIRLWLCRCHSSNVYSCTRRHRTLQCQPFDISFRGTRTDYFRSVRWDSFKPTIRASSAICFRRSSRTYSSRWSNIPFCRSVKTSTANSQNPFSPIARNLCSAISQLLVSPTAINQNLSLLIAHSFFWLTGQKLSSPIARNFFSGLFSTFLQHLLPPARPSITSYLLQRLFSRSKIPAKFGQSDSLASTTSPAQKPPLDVNPGES